MLCIEWDVEVEINPSGFFKNIPEIPFLLPSNNKIPWLQKYRPQVLHFLEATGEVITENNLILLLLKHMHSIEQKANDDYTYSVYQGINLAILQQPQRIWPMLLRAEAWLTVRNQKRCNWGGKR